MKTTNWESILPVYAIENDTIIGSTSGEITIAYQLLLPEVYTMSVADYKSVNEEYKKLISILPYNSVIHKQDYFYTTKYKTDKYIESTIELEDSRHFHDRSLLNHYSKLYITFRKYAQKGNKTPFITEQTTKLKPKELEKYLSELKHTISEIDSYLSTTKYIKAHRLKNNELGTTLHSYLSLSYIEQTEDYKEEILPPLSAENELQIGNEYVKVVSLIQESDKVHSSNKYKAQHTEGTGVNSALEMDASFLFPVGLGLTFDHILNTTIFVIDKDQLLKDIEIEKRNLNVTKFISSDARSKHQAIIEFQNTLSEHNYIPVEMSVNVILHNTNIEKLNSNVSHTKTAFNTIGAKTWVENSDTANLFFANCPGAGHLNYRKLLTIADLAVCYLPKETHYYSDQKGLLFADRFGNPKIIDFWDSKYIVNRNFLVIGGSGTGKSFNTNNIGAQLLYTGNHLTIIDIGHSYKKSCELNGGKYFDSSKIKELSFNPFLNAPKDVHDNYIYISENEEEAEDLINSIYTIIVCIWKADNPVTQEEKTILKEVIKSFYEYVNTKNIFPNLIEFAKYIPEYKKQESNHSRYFDFDSLQLLLKPYTDGEYKHLLNASENIDITNDKFIVFDVENIAKNKDIFNIVSLIIIELNVQKIKKLKGIKKTLFIDEGLDFLLDEKMGDYTAELFRKIRKHEGQIGLATQNVSFLKNINPMIRDSILTNTDIKILLDHKAYKSSYKDIQSILSFTDNDIKQLDSITNTDTYREFLIKLGNHTSVFRCEVSQFAAGVYTSKQSEVVEIEKYYEQTGSITTAIKQFVENKKLN